MTSNPIGAEGEYPTAEAPPVSPRHFRRGVASVGGGSVISIGAMFIEAVIVARSLPIEAMGAH